ncbi:MAG: ABC transporter ATP-binding protein [Gemmatimonadaceae bacterium]
MISFIDVNAMSKRFGEFWALRDASFAIRRGEVLGLIGPNGSGKSTLFGCMAGLIPSSGGSFISGNREVPIAERKQHLYFVPDGVHPWNDQNVAWVLRFVARLHGASPDAMQTNIEDFSLGAFLGARLNELSKGEHRRVMLALGLLSEAPLLLLDEPFDGLDLRQTREAMTVLRQHAAAGRTLFLSIHQLNDAARVCDRLVLLSAGRVVGEGTLSDLRARAGVSDAGVEEVFLALTN